MSTLIIFYSYTGKAKKLAETLAAQKGADILELKDEKRPSVFRAYVAGSLAARKQKQATLLPFHADFAAYEQILIIMPVWAGFPAPAFNNVTAALPAGKKVEIIMTSGGGDSGKVRVLAEATLKEKGCELVGFEDVKAKTIV